MGERGSPKNTFRQKHLSPGYYYPQSNKCSFCFRNTPNAHVVTKHVPATSTYQTIIGVICPDTASGLEKESRIGLASPGET